jgi:hypothetical protein
VPQLLSKLADSTVTIANVFSGLQGSYPAVDFSVINLARSGVDVTPAALCWYQKVPQVRRVGQWPAEALVELLQQLAAVAAVVKFTTLYMCMCM